MSEMALAIEGHNYESSMNLDPFSLFINAILARTEQKNISSTIIV